MAKGKSGGKRANGGKSNIEKSVIQFQGRVTFNVTLTGTPEDVHKANVERKSIAQNLKKYVTSKTSDGSPISPEDFNGFTNGSKSEIADYVSKKAVQLSFGNDSLINDKLNQTIETQNDVVNRLNRLNNIFSNHTNAKSWIGKDNAYNISEIKQYIDGKIDKLSW